MNRFYLTLLLCTTLALCSCGTGYVIEDDGVYIDGWNAAHGNYKYKIEEADPNTFKHVECGCNTMIGKDQNYVFHGSEIIQNADAATFTHLQDYYFKTKDSIYFFGFYNNINDCEIPISDPSCFTILTYPWAKCGNILIHGHDTLTLSDIQNFKVINDDYGKTADKVIYCGDIVEGADAASFQIIDSWRAKDKNHQYEYGEMVE